MTLINGNLIQSLREQKAWDQKTLAQQAGVDASVISRLERNLQQDAKLSILFSIASALDVTVNDLLNTTAASQMDIQLEEELNTALALLSKENARAQIQVAAIIHAYIRTLPE